MIEVQCPSCQTRYRIDESVLPQDSPTFKCSRCGHVFTGDPRLSKRPPILKGKSAPPPKAAAPSPAAPAAPPQAGVNPAPQPPAPQPAAPQPAAAPPPQRVAASIEPEPQPAPPPARALSADLPPPAVPQPPRPVVSSGDLRAASYPRPQATPTPAQAPPAAPSRPAAPSPAQTAGDAPEADDTDNPLARSFAEEEPKDPENLSFDFGDDAGERHQMGEAVEAEEPEDPGDRWQVGEPETDPIEELRRTPDFGRSRVRREMTAERPLRRPSRPAPEAEPREERGTARSSGFFLGLFALVVIGFVILTFVLGISPSTSRALLAQLPLVGEEFTSAPAKPSAVALNEIHAEYRALDKHRSALIVSGRAENRSEESLHTIQVAVSLVDGDRRPVVTQAVFCGDLVSPKIVSQMTPRELQFFQKLAPPKNFVLKAGESSPFFVMFINPPPNVASFQVSVLKAERASPPAETAAASGA
jgi:predicted Zn finger-like uncharacterized protein